MGEREWLLDKDARAVKRDSVKRLRNMRLRVGAWRWALKAQRLGPPLPGLWGVKLLAYDARDCPTELAEFLKLADGRDGGRGDYDQLAAWAAAEPHIRAGVQAAIDVLLERYEEAAGG